MNTETDKQADNPEVSWATTDLISPGKGASEVLPPLVLIRSIALTGIFIILVIFSLHAAADILIPMVIAYSLNLLLSPLIARMSRTGIPAPLSAGIVMIVFITLCFSALYSLSSPAEEWIERSPRVIGEVKAKLKPLIDPFAGAQQAANSVENIISDERRISTATTVKLAPTTGRLERMLSNISSTLGRIGIVVVLLYFLLAAGDSFLNKLVTAIPKLKDKKRAVSIIRDIQRDTSQYLMTRTLINIGLGAVIAGALYLLGMPNPVLWGALAALLNFAPYVGPAISLGIIGTAAVISMDSMAEALIVPAVVFAINIIEGEFISHQIIGRRLALSPVVVFVSIVFWGWLWGIAGALMAIPIIAAINVICQTIEPLKPLSDFMRDSRNSNVDPTL